MKSSFIAYVDESGDEGFVFNPDGSGSSRWFVLSAAVIRQTNDLQMVSCLKGKRDVLQKPALEWIMERYQFSKDKASGITNAPNDWCREHDNPRYIADLIKRVTRVSIETNKIVASLPELNERSAG
jgi:hypothetical protein